jgi:hypothetical protein
VPEPTTVPEQTKVPTPGIWKNSLPWVTFGKISVSEIIPAVYGMGSPGGTVALVAPSSAAVAPLRCNVRVPTRWEIGTPPETAIGSPASPATFGPRFATADGSIVASSASAERIRAGVQNSLIARSSGFK